MSRTPRLTSTYRTSMEDLTPTQIVAELDKYIVGQKDAKRAVAIALRNRYRRRMLNEDLRDEMLRQTFGSLFGGVQHVTPTESHEEPIEEDEEEDARQRERDERIRQKLRDQIRAGAHDDKKVDIEVEQSGTPFLQVFSPQGM